jgi:hypothetical protein
MGDFTLQLGLSIGIGFALFVLWQLSVCFLSDFWPDSDRRRKSPKFCARVKERGHHAFAFSDTKWDFFHRNLHLGSPQVEKWRRKVSGLIARSDQQAAAQFTTHSRRLFKPRHNRFSKMTLQDAFRAFLTRACRRYLKKRQGRRKAQDEPQQPRRSWWKSICCCFCQAPENQSAQDADWLTEQHDAEKVAAELQLS